MQLEQLQKEMGENTSQDVLRNTSPKTHMGNPSDRMMPVETTGAQVIHDHTRKRSRMEEDISHPQTLKTFSLTNSCYFLMGLLF